MSANTSIEWTDRTWNPVRGCSRVSEGCRNCYAETMAARFSAPGGPFAGFANRANGGSKWTGRVELVPGKLAEPLSWRKPQRCFVNSMSDLFHEALPFEDIAAVFGVMAAAPHITFQILTKRPERMNEFFSWLPTIVALDGSPQAACIILAEQQGAGNRHSLASRIESADDLERWPLPNVQLGVSVENQGAAGARIPLLLECPAAVRFVSYEPALGPVDFTGLRSAGHSGWIDALGKREHRGPACFERDTGIDWLIVGGESGPGARPFDLAWARSTVEQCKAAGVPVFVKQLGARPFFRPDESIQVRPEIIPSVLGACKEVLLRDRKGGDPEEWPEDIRVRQFPEVHP